MVFNFPFQWEMKILEECMDSIIDYRGKTPKKAKHGVPLITAKIVKEGQIKTPNEFIDEEDYEKWMRRGFPMCGDVIITTEAPLGEIAQLDDRKVALAQRLITLRGKKEIVDNTFLKYLMQSHYVQNQIKSRASGTTVLGIKQRELRKILLPIPPMREQNTIAHILGTLDDKIELNRQMNEILEAMAKTIFKSWFVDFDPVRAEIEGRKPYGMDEETAALFPDEFEDSELGEIPKGWKIGKLEDMLILQRGFDLPKRNLIPGPYPVLYASGSSASHNEYKVKGPGITTGRSGSLGNVFFVHENFWPHNTSLWVKEYKISTPTHAYFLLQTFHFGTYNAGSAVPTLNRNHVHNILLVIPPKQIIECYNEYVFPLFIQKHHNEKQIQVLSSIRDALLPKLISGEIRVMNLIHVLQNYQMGTEF